MSHQILGLRSYVDSRTNKVSKRQVFFEKNWTVPSIGALLNDPDGAISAIPEEMRVNVYCTVADCFDGTEARKMREQWELFFDIDSLGIDSDVPEIIKAHCLKVLAAVCGAIGADVSKVGAIFSGNGMQFFIRLMNPILAEEFFSTMREAYKLVCAKMQNALMLAHMAGKVDTNVFDAARLFRMPNTWNEKEHGKRRAFVVQKTLESQEFGLLAALGDTEIKKADTLDKTVWHTKHYVPDAKGILTECEYIKFCAENQSKVSEGQWYALLGVLAFLPGGDDVGHKYSCEHPGYDPQETQDKLDQARRASGPRTCKDIGGRWEGCGQCKHYNVITSPILIRSQEFIATKDTGFRHVKINDNGKPTASKVAYDDLIKQYFSEHEYCKVPDAGMYIYDNTEKIWEEVTRDEVGSWADKKIIPSASSNELKEFVHRLEFKNLVERDWMDNANDTLVNFRNGVLNTETLQLHPHDSKYGFKHILPFDYDPRAVAPNFEKFLNDVMCEDQELVQMLLEYAGYCISGANYWCQKALFLVGTGANGKSVFMDVLKTVLGKNTYSCVTLQKCSDSNFLSMLVNKLVNFSEETSVNSLLKSEDFKALTSGAELSARIVYRHSFVFKNKAKIIVACNEFPQLGELTHAMCRRLAIVPFNRTFSEKQQDKGILKKLVAEASGIYNLLIAAYSRMKQREYLIEAVAAMRASEEVMHDADNIQRFIEDKVIFDPSLRVISSELYNAYSMYCTTMGEKNNIINNVKFSKRISAVLGARVEFKVIRKGNQTHRGVEGMGIRSDF